MGCGVSQYIAISIFFHTHYLEGHNFEWGMFLPLFHPALELLAAGTKALTTFSSSADMIRQYDCSGFCQQAGQGKIPSVAHTDCASHSHLGPRSTELLGKPTFQRQPSVCRVKTPSRGDQSDLSMLRSSQSGSVCLKQEHSVVHVLFLERLHCVLLYVLP